MTNLGLYRAFRSWQVRLLRPSPPLPRWPNVQRAPSSGVADSPSPIIGWAPRARPIAG
jgi:hypothetical protein